MAPKPKLIASLRLLALLLCFGAVSGTARALRAWSAGTGLLAPVAALGGYAGLWLLVSLHPPRRSAGWVELVPGALVFGIGVEVIAAIVNATLWERRTRAV